MEPVGPLVTSYNTPRIRNEDGDILSSLLPARRGRKIRFLIRANPRTALTNGRGAFPRMVILTRALRAFSGREREGEAGHRHPESRRVPSDLRVIPESRLRILKSRLDINYDIMTRDANKYPTAPLSRLHSQRFVLLSHHPAVSSGGSASAC